MSTQQLRRPTRRQLQSGSGGGVNRRTTSTKDELKELVRARIRARKEQKGQGRKYNIPPEVSFFQPRHRCRVDILPYRVTRDTNPDVPPGKLCYVRTVWVHYGIGLDDRSYICPKTIGQRCPICEHRAKLIKEKSPDEQLVAALKPKQRELYNVIDLDEPDKGVQLWEISYHLFGAKLEEEIDEGEEDWAAFADLEQGYTLRLRFSERTLGRNKFLEVSRIDFEPRDPYPESILDEVLDLDAILNVPTYEQLEKAFFELDNGDTGEELVGEGDVVTAEEEEVVYEEDIGGGEEEEVIRKQVLPPRRSSTAAGSKGGREQQEEEAERPRRHSPSPPSRRSVTVTAAATAQRRSRPVREEEPESPAEEQQQQRECPYGGTFGADYDRLDECMDCEIWNECYEEFKARYGEEG